MNHDPLKCGNDLGPNNKTHGRASANSNNPPDPMKEVPWTPLSVKTLARGNLRGRLRTNGDKLEACKVEVAQEGAEEIPQAAISGMDGER